MSQSIIAAGQGESASITPLTSDRESNLLAEPPRTKYAEVMRSFLLRFCVAVTIGVTCLAAVELFSYLISLHNQPNSMEPDVRAKAIQGSAREHEYWKEHAAANKVQYRAYVLWRGAPFHGSAISIDEEGLRRTVHTRCDGDNFTIWMFGDSTMWGTGAPDEETIPSLLAGNYERAGKPSCIVNYAEKGWTSTQELIALIEELKHNERKPQVVLFYDGGSEAFAAWQNRRIDVHNNYLGFKKYLEGWEEEQRAGFGYLRRTNTFRHLRALAEDLTGKPQSPQLSEAEVKMMAAAIMQNYLQNMDLIHLLATRYGFRPVFVWYPNLLVGHKQLTSAESALRKRADKVYPGMDAIYRAAYEQCRDTSRLDLYYWADIFDATRTELYKDMAHVNAAGNQIVADRLFAVVEHSPRSGAAPNPPSPSYSRPSAHLSSQTKTPL
ncbi:MAG: SGNH/GDSL hydrolase family protein [Acidobacteria bacterium]|nr:SGNH/GDSL hydrolase family protein [Acidobacteriota bacterium]